MKKSLNSTKLVFCLLIFNVFFINANPLSVYLSPHQDDFFLFMGENIQNDLKNDSDKLVFLMITDGDAAQKNLNYVVARNAGAKEAIRYLGDYFVLGKKVEKTDTVMLNNHKIERFSYKNISMYFISVPCGYFNYSIADVPLGKLFRNDTICLSSTNKLTTYTSWSDLTTTIDSIIVKENKYNDSVVLNSLDYNQDYNRNDHPDHIITGQITRELSYRNENNTARYYVGYNTSNKNPNLNLDYIINNVAMFTLYDRVLRYGGWFNNMGSQHLGWQSRSYWRKEVATDTESKIKDKLINLNLDNNTLYISSGFKIIGNIKIYNISGMCIYSGVVNKQTNDTYVIQNLPVLNNVYFYEIYAKRNCYRGKLF